MTRKESSDLSPLEPFLGALFRKDIDTGKEQMGKEIPTVIYFDVTLSKPVPPWVLGSQSILGKVAGMVASVGAT